jgi:type I restriction enzyme, R subunit
LIFAVNDLPHTSHADQLVGICGRLRSRGGSVEKIRARVDRPLERIREFRNRQTRPCDDRRPPDAWIDIPDLELLVFLRPVTRILLLER